MSPTLWYLLPAYNEAANLGPLLADFRTTLETWPGGPPPCRVVVVDDGSKDETAQVARDAPGLETTVIVHDPNQGLGAAMRTGISHVLAHAAPGDRVVTMDADHTHPPETIPAMWDRMDAGAGLVIASRFQPGAEVHGLGLVRKGISVASSALLRALFPAARDYTCGFRMYRVADLAWGARHYGSTFLNQQGFSVMVDLLLKLRRRARPIEEVPLILRYDRKQGESKMRVLRTAWSTLVLLRRRLVGDPR